MVYVILQHTAVRTERTISKRWEMSYRDETKDNKLILLIALLHPKKRERLQGNLFGNGKAGLDSL